MKTGIAFLSMLVLVLLQIPGQAQEVSATLTKAEREKAVVYLQKTRDEFLASIDGLSDAQWKFKASADRWSIAEVAEHIGLAEQTIFGMVMQAAKSAPTPEKKAAVKGKDEIIMKVIPNRDAGKAQAPEILKPVGRWANREDLTKDFKSNRTKTTNFVSDTAEDLRSRFMEHPVLKTLDAYQWLLFLAAHSDRHIAQIVEVKAQPTFPKN